MIQDMFLMVYKTIPDEVFYSTDISDGAKILYAQLLSMCYKKDHCWPKIQYLQDKLNRSRSHIKRQIKELIDNELLTKEKTGRGDVYKPRGVRYEPSEGSDTNPPLINNIKEIKAVSVGVRDNERKRPTSTPTPTPTACCAMVNQDSNQGIEQKQTSGQDERTIFNRYKKYPIADRPRDDGVVPDGEVMYSQLKNNGVKKLADKVVDYFETVTGRDCAKRDYNMRFILERINDGGEFFEFKGIIDVKYRQWKGSKKMREFIRPQTLFAKDNYMDYLDEF